MLKAVVWPSADIERLNEVALELNYSINLGMIDSERKLCHFLGQAKREAGPNLRFEEQISKAQANKNYAKSSSSLGNGKEADGNGYKYRGRGILQITGKANYQGFRDDYKKIWGNTPPDFLENPDIVAEFPFHTRSALWFWVKRDCIDYAAIDRIGETFTPPPRIVKKKEGVPDVHTFPKETGEKNSLSYSVSKAVSSVINFYEKKGIVIERYNNSNNCYKSGVFKDVCYNTRIQLNNPKAYKPINKS